MRKSFLPAAKKALMLLALLAMYVGVQAIFIAGSYYSPRWPILMRGVSRTEQLHLTIWIVVVANVVMLGGSYLMSLRKQPGTEEAA